VLIITANTQRLNVTVRFDVVQLAELGDNNKVFGKIWHVIKIIKVFFFIKIQVLHFPPLP